MDHKPRDKDEPIINRRMMIALGLQSIGLTIAVLVAYRLGYSVIGDGTENSLHLARTLAFVTLILGEMLRALLIKNRIKIYL